MDGNTTNLKELIRDIENHLILLPDFQREFVWRDEELQKKLIASVLTRMPIGSILLLKSKPDEYSSKQIGCKTPIDSSILKQDVDFLLDGQQRVTVLTNVFSNVIHDQCKKVNDLISPSLKRRFFLMIPKWATCRNETDIFGVYDLIFKYKNPASCYPDFLTIDIYRFIKCYSFTATDKSPYNPQIELSVDLDNYCLSYEDGYLIPLYLLAPTDNNRDQIVLRSKKIREAIAENIGKEIINHFTGIPDTIGKESFIDEIVKDEKQRKRCKEDYAKFEHLIEDRAGVWENDLKDYLETCIERLALNKIVVAEEQRARAIDIYENLNRGGISLNTFDLIMARVAKVSKENYYRRIVNCMTSTKYYSKDILPDNMVSLIGKQIDKHEYNATVAMECYNSSKNDISSLYINAFLDVLSLYCHNVIFDPDEYKVDNIKRDQILNLTPEQIDDNTEKVIIALDRALFFLQTRCGIRSIQELNYALVLVLLATIFIKDEYFNDKQIHNYLEAWYWSAVFAGEYDKDQNVTMITHLQTLIKRFQASDNELDADWILKIEENVLNSQNFSDKQFLLMEKVDEDRYPKSVLRFMICQYLLSKTYTDMFDSSKRISVFCKEADELEAHHIIPLGSAKKIGESSKKLREDDKNICNSPLNYVYITKQANKEISDDDLEVYAKSLCDEAKSKLWISDYSASNPSLSDDGIKSILSQRYNFLRGDIKDHIKALLGV